MSHAGLGLADVGAASQGVARSGLSGSPTDPSPLSTQQAQIFLQSNAALSRKLKHEDIKPRLLGMFSPTPPSPGLARLGLIPRHSFPPPAGSSFADHGPLSL